VVTRDDARVAALIVIPQQEYEQEQEFVDDHVHDEPEGVTCPKPRTGCTRRTASPRPVVGSGAGA